MALVEAPLKTKYDRKIEHLRTHFLESTHRFQNIGLYHEFTICAHESPRPLDSLPSTTMKNSQLP